GWKAGRPPWTWKRASTGSPRRGRRAGVVATEPPPLPPENRVAIRSDADIVTARQQGRALAQRLGSVGSNLTVIATAISELGRNILTYAGSGEIVLRPTRAGNKHGLLVVARDQGPGIPDIALAMQ